METKRIGRGDRTAGSEIWYSPDFAGIVIPDYKRRYGTSEQDRLVANRDLFQDLDGELRDIGLPAGEAKVDLQSDCGMGLDFPVIALLVSASIALPGAIVNTIKLIERIRAYVQRKRRESSLADAPTLGEPLFDPRLLERYSYEKLIRELPTLVEAGGDLKHVVTVDTSFKSKYYQYGVVYLIVFRSTLPTKAELYPVWTVRITCTAEILEITQLLSEDHMPPHLYFDNAAAYKKATGDKDDDKDA